MVNLFENIIKKYFNWLLYYIFFQYIDINIINNNFIRFDNSNFFIIILL
jgi:hypothetical protein